jgi:hypothetical protein
MRLVSLSLSDKTVDLSLIHNSRTSLPFYGDTIGFVFPYTVLRAAHPRSNGEWFPPSHRTAFTNTSATGLPIWSTTGVVNAISNM